MIRINLLEIDRRGRPRITMSAPNRVQVAAGLLLLSAGLTIAVWTWSLRETSRSLDRDLTSIEAEIQQLQASLPQREKVDTRRQELQKHVAAIEQLLTERVDVARVLHELAAATPDSLRFVEVAHKYPELTVKGHAPTLAVVSDLVSRLDGSGLFRAAVEIVETERTADAVAGPSVRFSLKAMTN